MRLGRKARNPASLFDAGKAAYGRGDLEGAVRDFTHLIELEPDLPPGYYERGLAYARSGRLVEAAADFVKAAELGRTVIVGNTAQSREQLVRAEYNCGLTYERLGRYELALEHYDCALELQPTLSEAWCNRGNVLLQLGEDERAAESHTNAIAVDPGDYNAYLGRAIANNERSRQDEVVRDLEEFLRLAPAGHPQIGIARATLARYSAG
jgi:tetratricopeptide (TPR) repeat protein